MVVQRDVSESVRIRGEDTVVVTMVLDVKSDKLLATRVAGDAPGLLREALQEALTSPYRKDTTAAPARVLSPIDLRPAVLHALGHIKGMERTNVVEIVLGDDVEDLFDSLISHLNGRIQPDESASPEDWATLYGQVVIFARERVWDRWSDDLPMEVTLSRGNSKRRFRAVVLGNAGIQVGRALIPEDPSSKPPDPGTEPSLPPGAIMMSLDIEGVPPELVARARRYGWPADEELIPLFIAGGDPEPRELGREDARTLAAALAAVVDHDIHSTAGLDEGSSPGIADAVETSGIFRLENDKAIRYHVRDLVDLDEGQFGPLLLTDILPKDAAIGMEVVPWEAYEMLRNIPTPIRTFLPVLPEPTGPGIPLVFLDVGRRHGSKVASRLAELGPLGVDSVVLDGEAAVLLVCPAGLVPLAVMDEHDPVLRRFQRRRRSLDGVHALLVVDRGRMPEHSAIYGLFECKGPVTGSGPPSTPSSPSPPARRRPKKKRGR